MGFMCFVLVVTKTNKRSISFSGINALIEHRRKKFQPKSKVFKIEISIQQGIFLRKKYDGTDSKCFIKIQPYSVLARVGERRGFHQQALLDFIPRSPQRTAFVDIVLQQTLISCGLNFLQILCKV